MIIYKVTNLVNNKIYIGQTVQPLSKRWAAHQCKGHILFNAIEKYGVDNFTVETIDTATDIEELNKKEIDWIDRLNTLSPNGYNLRLGGKNGGKLSEETKKKIGLASVGRKHTEEWKQNASERLSGDKNPMFGKRISNESAQKRLVSMKKYYDDPGYLEKISQKAIERWSVESEREKILDGLKKFRTDPQKVLELHDKLAKISRSVESRLKRAKRKGGKPFVCNETGERFEMLSLAAERFGVDKRRIHSVLKRPDRYKSIKDKTGSVLTFSYIGNEVS